MSAPICALCQERPASCIGCYEDHAREDRPHACDQHGDDYACDECCGHGNEDGYCWPLADIPGDAKIRTSLEEFLHGHGIHFPRDHGFVPHITLAYSPDHVRFLPKITPPEFPVNEIWHCRGGRWESMPLGRRSHAR